MDLLRGSSDVSEEEALLAVPSQSIVSMRDESLEPGRLYRAYDSGGISTMRSIAVGVSFEPGRLDLAHR
jgi:hypothetical protein